MAHNGARENGRFTFAFALILMLRPWYNNVVGCIYIYVRDPRFLFLLLLLRSRTKRAMQKDRRRKFS